MGGNHIMISRHTAFSTIARVGWFLALIVVFWQTLTPVPLECSANFNDKVGHFLVFMILTVWGLLAWYSSQPRHRQIVAFLILFGIVIECAQYFVPTRFFSLPDWGADIVGVIFGLIGFRYFLSTQLSSKLLTQDFQRRP